MNSNVSKTDQDDIALFQKEIGEIEHLIQDKIHPITNSIKPEPKCHQQQLKQKCNDTFSEEYEPRTIGSGESLAFRRSGIQQRLFSRLKKGHLTIEAALDLHGMTISVAHEELAQFLHNCQHYSIRCARIIHGKGCRSKQQKPVLKTNLNGWLQQNDNVLAFCSAPIEDGGTGAVYVLLRRSNKDT